jgi:hypothetical protein
MARGRHGHATDLALDPDVLEPVVAPDGVTDGAGDLRDAQDPRACPLRGLLERL